MLVSFIPLATIFTGCMVALVFIVKPGPYMTLYFKSLEKRAVHHQETAVEVAGLQAAYGGMIFVGSALYPEASQVLYEFCWGGGDNPNINASYVRNSPFIRKKLKNLKPGQAWEGWYHQTEDVRLSYAFNPIKIKKQRDGQVVVTSPIKVAKLGSGVYTRLYMGPLSFNLPDSLMRVACDEKEYTARVTWYE
jgi:hypothetical protein